MERVPEVECMDDPAEARAYAEMDHSEANRAFVEDLICFRLTAGDLLDLGTGPADIPILLAKALPDVRITALDLSHEMLKIARLRVAEAGLSARIRLMPGDAKALPFGDEQFDGVFSNTILHHVSDPRLFFVEAARVCRSGGRLFVRDLHRPDNEDELAELVARHAAGANEEQRRLFADSLRAAYTTEELMGLAAAAGLDGCRIERSSDRHLTLSWIKP